MPTKTLRYSLRLAEKREAIQAKRDLKRGSKSSADKKEEQMVEVMKPYEPSTPRRNRVHCQGILSRTAKKKGANKRTRSKASISTMKTRTPWSELVDERSKWALFDGPLTPCANRNQNKAVRRLKIESEFDQMHGREEIFGGSTRWVMGETSLVKIFDGGNSDSRGRWKDDQEGDVAEHEMQILWKGKEEMDRLIVKMRKVDIDRKDSNPAVIDATAGDARSTNRLGPEGTMIIDQDEEMGRLGCGVGCGSEGLEVQTLYPEKWIIERSQGVRSYPTEVCL